MLSRFDVAIIGAGIVGAACALELAQAGLAVAVIECDTVGGGATAAGMGHLVAMDDSPAQLELTLYSQRLWQRLVLEEAAYHEHVRCGTLWLAADDTELAAVHEKREIYGARGIASSVLDERALYEAEPNLRPGLAGGLLVPGDSAVYPPRSAALLMERAQRLGAVLVPGQAAELAPTGVRLAGGASVSAERIVIANGARCTELLPELPVRPKKGHLAITDRYPDCIRHQLVELGYIKRAHAAEGDSVAFNIQPRSTGQILIGSSRQLDDASRAVDHRILSRMLAHAIEYLPQLERLAVIRVWTGLRAATPDGLPLIGPHPARPGVWLATGHEGLGITTAPATARLLAAQMQGRAAEIPHEPYLPARALQEAPYA